MMEGMRRRVVGLMTVCAAAVLLVACGDDRTDVGTGGPSTTSPATTSTSTDAPTSTTAAGALPGERVEIFPYEGASLAVVGVEAGDTLNVRERPGTDSAVAFELEPLDMGFTATGHNRDMGDSFWSEINSEGRTGWANTSFLLQPGATDDITSQVAPNPEDRPRADTMRALGMAVAEPRASDEPPSRIVVVAGPSVGDLGEITIDIIGLGDDAVGGERLHIFGEPEDGGEGFVLRTVERTVLCSRGVSDGNCV